MKKIYLGLILTFAHGLLFADIIPTVKLGMVYPQGSPTYQHASQALGVAFRRINRPYTLIYLPPERAYRSFSSGVIDGEVGRIYDYGERFPQAIRVATPLFSFAVVAVGRKGAAPLHTWEEARQQHVAYQRGIKIYEEKFRDARAAEVVDSTLACLMMVKTGRSDYCVSTQGEAELVAASMRDGEFSRSKIADASAYIYLHRNFASLAAELNVALAGMQQSGELATIFNSK